jgi:hypothetical protein
MVQCDKGFEAPLGPDMLEFASLLGYMDLQTHVLNRLMPPNHVWHTYCRGQTGIHSPSGLPFSLLDLLSSVHLPGTDAALWFWVVPNGAVAQRCVWKATRFAGIISYYRFPGSQDEPAGSSNFTPSPGVLVRNILAMIQQCLVFVPTESASFKQTMMYPLVMAASRRVDLDRASKSFICQTIEQLASERNHFLYRGILRTVREFWQSQDETIEHSANRLGIELCLL